MTLGLTILGVIAVVAMLYGTCKLIPDWWFARHMKREHLLGLHDVYREPFMRKYCPWCRLVPPTTDSGSRC